MLKHALLVVLASFSFAMVANAENQVDEEIKVKAAKVAEKKVFSKINADTKKEEVYELTAAQAAALPKGDATKLSKEEKQKLEVVIADITSKKPAREFDLAESKDAAKTACRWYGRGYYGGYGGGYYGGYYGGGYGYGYGYGYSTCGGYYGGCGGGYYGGGCYYSGGYYGASYAYSGYYSSNYYNGGCYWN